MRYYMPFLAVMLMTPVGAVAQPLIQSQEGIALQNEILQLQQQVQQLQQSGRGGNGNSSLGSASAPVPPASSGGSTTNPLLPGLLTQVQQLQSQVQTLSGQVADLQHQVNDQNAQTQQQIGDLKFQMANGAGGSAAPKTGGALTAATAAAKPATSTAAPVSPAATPAVPTAPRDVLKAALSAYDQHDYRRSTALAQDLVTNHKSAPEAYRAQYLVAQSETALGSSQNAAVAFYNTYNMNKTGTYAPKALLGLASSLADLKQNPQACETIASLNSQFTTPSPGMKRDIDKVAARAHCS